MRNFIENNHVVFSLNNLLVLEYKIILFNLHQH